jgi:hypothetical protein
MISSTRGTYDITGLWRPPVVHKPSKVYAHQLLKGKLNYLDETELFPKSCRSRPFNRLVPFYESCKDNRARAPRFVVKRFLNYLKHHPSNVQTPYTKPQLLRAIHRDCVDVNRVTEEVKNEICSEFGNKFRGFVNIKDAICCSLVIFDYVCANRMFSEHGTLAEYYQYSQYDSQEFSRYVRDGVSLRGVPDLVENGVVTEYKVRHCELTDDIRYSPVISDQLQLYMFITGHRKAFLVEEFDCETLTTEIYYDERVVEFLLAPIRR